MFQKKNLYPFFFQQPKPKPNIKPSTGHVDADKDALILNALNNIEPKTENYVTVSKEVRNFINDEPKVN